jgi:hypothetical protein
MNAEQMQKWSVLRQEGRTSYLRKRTLIWGMMLSVAKIAFSYFTKFLVAAPIVNTLYFAVYSKERTINAEDAMVRFITNGFFDAIGCFVLAGFIALAVWTYKEQNYQASITFEAKQN